MNWFSKADPESDSKSDTASQCEPVIVDTTPETCTLDDGVPPGFQDLIRERPGSIIAQLFIDLMAIEGHLQTIARLVATEDICQTALIMEPLEAAISIIQDICEDQRDTDDEAEDTAPSVPTPVTTVAERATAMRQSRLIPRPDIPATDVKAPVVTPTVVGSTLPPFHILVTPPRSQMPSETKFNRPFSIPLNTSLQQQTLRK